MTDPILASRVEAAKLIIRGERAGEEPEASALCELFDHLLQRATQAGPDPAELLAHKVTIFRMNLCLRLLRAFALSGLVVPDQHKVISLLRDYIDQGRWVGIPWPPAEMGFLCGWLTQNGYANIDGAIGQRRTQDEPAQH